MYYFKFNVLARKINRKLFVKILPKKPAQFG